MMSQILFWLIVYWIGYYLLMGLISRIIGLVLKQIKSLSYEFICRTAFAVSFLLVTAVWWINIIYLPSGQNSAEPLLISLIQIVLALTAGFVWLITDRRQKPKPVPEKEILSCQTPSP
jgi:hypothetical protein